MALGGLLSPTGGSRGGSGASSARHRLATEGGLSGSPASGGGSARSGGPGRGLSRLFSTPTSDADLLSTTLQVRWQGRGALAAGEAPACCERLTQPLLALRLMQWLDSLGPAQLADALAALDSPSAAAAMGAGSASKGTGAPGGGPGGRAAV